MTLNQLREFTFLATLEFGDGIITLFKITKDVDGVERIDMVIDTEEYGECSISIRPDDLTMANDLTPLAEPVKKPTLTIVK
jgi:hypothetical protein